MYVYVAEFRDRNGLVKIGFSDDAHQRIKQLEAIHGEAEMVAAFYAGYKARYVEMRAHQVFDAFRVRVPGAGGNEFFSKSIVNDVTSYIEQRHLPAALEPLLREEQRELLRCMEFSRRLLMKSRGKDRKGDVTFNGQKSRISLGIQILIEHGMPERDAYQCYANVLNTKSHTRLTGQRLKVVLRCSDYAMPLVYDKAVHSVNYAKSIQRRLEMEVKLDVERRSL